MDIVKNFSRRAFLVIVLFMAVIMLLVDLSFYYGADAIFRNITISGHAGQSAEVIGLLDNIVKTQQQVRMYFVPAAGVVFALFAVLLWLVLRSILSNFVKQGAVAADGASSAEAKPSAEELKKREIIETRLFLHLLSVFQREGRLVDFFSENLSHYEDDQIGAAVRSIHESCNDAIKKYLSLDAVIDQNEGEEVTVPEGFNPSAIKLTGNVAGNPPFKGILRHRGWRAAKLELPTLSAGETSKIIAPAEVEIR